MARSSKPGFPRADSRSNGGDSKRRTAGRWRPSAWYRSGGMTKPLPSAPVAGQPCLHRVLADCHGPEGILWFANLYGLLTVAASPAQADLPAEPLDACHKEIRALRTCTAVWGAIAGKDETELRRLLQHPKKDVLHQRREFLTRKLAEKMAAPDSNWWSRPTATRISSSSGNRPMRLIDAAWQRFAQEISGAITYTKCPAPKCGRWFPKSAGRSDRKFCSHACQMRAWRGGRKSL
jgi:hypothetical protein